MSVLSFAKPIAEPFIGRHCSKELLDKLNFTNIDCLKLVISKGLSVGIIAGGVFLKLPQILKIVSSKSVAGISFPAYLLETLSFTIFCAYNYRSQNPFTTWGEGIFITIQNLIILAMILSFTRQLPLLAVTGLVYAVIAYALITPTLINVALLTLLQSSTIFLGIASKLPQIWSIFRARSTGQLSAITVFLQFAGSAARVFTTIQELDDRVLLIGNAVASLLNAVIVLQMAYYWKKSSRARGGKKTAAAVSAKTPIRRSSRKSKKAE